MTPALRDETPARSGQADVTQATPVSRAVLDLSGRPEAMADMGRTARLAWAARTDVGSIREHNEDSYLAQPPLFAVCDGMGGHAAGEVASAIAIHSLALEAPRDADAQALGEAVETANRAVIEGAAEGQGREGMGCTCTACLIDEARMAVAHVGDSRLYLLHQGTLVRVTHDHSLVEELVDAGEITADEARTHPNRSWVTRALGSDPDMYADRFTLDVETGDRVLLCSDGLSSMVPDAEIEDICVSTPSPEVCVDALVSAALVAGGHDNVTCIVVDVVSDGTEEAARHTVRRAVRAWGIGAGVLFAAIAIAAAFIINSCWYLSTSGGYVAVYQGIEGDILGLSLSRLATVTDVSSANLPEALQHQLQDGIPVGSEDEALTTVESYREQVATNRAEAADTASQVVTSPSPQTEGSATPSVSTQAATGGVPGAAASNGATAAPNGGE